MSPTRKRSYKIIREHYYYSNTRSAVGKIKLCEALRLRACPKLQTFGNGAEHRVDGDVAEPAIGKSTNQSGCAACHHP